MIKSLIVAVSKELAIGRNGDMPWHLPGDLKYFKSVTMSRPVIMGRKTWESIGRPLPGRHNIVISSDASMKLEGADVVNSLSSAFERAGDVPEVFVIGGGRVYAEAMGIADRLYITRIEASVADADTFFPEIDPQEWELVSRSEKQLDERSAVVYSFEVYNRRSLIVNGEETRRIREPDDRHISDGGHGDRIG